MPTYVNRANNQALYAILLLLVISPSIINMPLSLPAAAAAAAACSAAGVIRAGHRE